MRLTRIVSGALLAVVLLAAGCGAGTSGGSSGAAGTSQAPASSSASSARAAAAAPAPANTLPDSLACTADYFPGKSQQWIITYDQACRAQQSGTIASEQGGDSAADKRAWCQGSADGEATAPDTPATLMAACEDGIATAA